MVSIEKMEKQAIVEAEVFNEAEDFLIQHLDPDDLFDDAIRENIISPSAQRKIRPSAEDKTRIMVEQFKRSGPGTLEKVCNMLRRPARNDRQGYIANFLESLHSDTYKPYTAVNSFQVKCKKPLDITEVLKERYRRDYPTRYVPLTMINKETSIPLGGLEEIFQCKSRSCPLLIMLNGSAGIGKTTVCNEICVRWARDGFLSRHFNTVLQIPMSMARQHSFAEAVIAQIGEDAYYKIVESSGTQCLIILDGMVATDLQKDTVLLQLVKGSILSKAVLLITARPQACNNLVCDSAVEITGFSKNQITQYVQNFSTVSQSHIQRKVNSCPLAKVVCFVPLFLVMMLSVFQCDPVSSLPSTITDLHHIFVAMSLQKNDLKTDQRPSSTFKPKEKLLAILPGSCTSEERRRMLLRLSELAYNLFFDQNNVTEDIEICFTEQNLHRCGIYLPEGVDFQESCLIKPKTMLQEKQDTMYCFTSNTVLVFLCSLHIAIVVSEKEQFSLMQKYFDKLPTVMIMLCGLTRLETPEIFHFVCRMLVDSHENRLTATKCLYESQRSNPPDGISHLSLSFCTPLLPHDILSISYVVHRYPVITLTLRECHLGNNGLKILTQWCEKQGTSLEKLDISINKLNIDALEDVLKIMKSSALLRVLDIGGNEIGDDGMKTICKELETNTTLTDLRMWNCGLSKKSATFINQMLSKNKTLKALIISSNSFGDEGMKELAKVLKCDTTLTELKMWECGLSIIGASIIAEVLQVNNTLKTLSIGGNNFGNEGIVVVARALNNSNLRELRAWRCGITCYGTKALARALRKHRTMKRLDLTGNEITSDGAYEVLSAAVDNETCEVVDINNNYCSDGDVSKLINALKRRKEGLPSFVKHPLEETKSPTSKETTLVV
ncbi:NACHT, LRR and PYD domains-containing protein 14-like isoform X2 [Dysidea avara]|uniref:NACHT, LRR and PYD domains-containing protein 14-like isoform X2 n=1 Tax=Dysidea avara TaxID=196820 RepID=UPI00331E2B2C